jgi:hypothetical protein
VEDHVGVRVRLDTVIAEVLGGEGTLPFGRGLWGFPAEITYRGRGVWDSFEGDYLLVCGVSAFDFAFVGLHAHGVGLVFVGKFGLRDMNGERCRGGEEQAEDCDGALGHRNLRR